MGTHSLKGTVSRDFLLLVFFMGKFPPRPRVGYPIRTVSNFLENSRRYSLVKVHHRVSTTPATNFAPSFASVVDTGGWTRSRKWHCPFNGTGSWDNTESIPVILKVLLNRCRYFLYIRWWFQNSFTPFFCKKNLNQNFGLFLWIYLYTILISKILPVTLTYGGNFYGKHSHRKPPVIL